MEGRPVRSQKTSADHSKFGEVLLQQRPSAPPPDGPAVPLRPRRNFRRRLAHSQEQAMLQQLTMGDTMPRCVFSLMKNRCSVPHCSAVSPIRTTDGQRVRVRTLSGQRGPRVASSGRENVQPESSILSVHPSRCSSSSQDRRSCSAVSRNRESVASVSSDGRCECNLARESSKTE
jgi:hypothetical protein